MALYDKVLGEQASAFATCTREDSKLCTECARCKNTSLNASLPVACARDVVRVVRAVGINSVTS